MTKHFQWESLVMWVGICLVALLSPVLPTLDSFGANSNPFIGTARAQCPGGCPQQKCDNNGICFFCGGSGECIVCAPEESGCPQSCRELFCKGPRPTSITVLGDAENVSPRLACAEAQRAITSGSLPKAKSPVRLQSISFNQAPDEQPQLRRRPLGYGMLNQKEAPLLLVQAKYTMKHLLESAVLENGKEKIVGYRLGWAVVYPGRKAEVRAGAWVQIPEGLEPGAETTVPGVHIPPSSIPEEASAVRFFIAGVAFPDGRVWQANFEELASSVKE